MITTDTPQRPHGAGPGRTYRGSEYNGTAGESVYIGRGGGGAGGARGAGGSTNSHLPVWLCRLTVIYLCGCVD